MALTIVILAAGQGKRMFSKRPKVLHCVGGKPLLEHVVQTAQRIVEKPPVVIFGHQGDEVRQALSGSAIHWVEQKEQLGTGHALQQALSAIPANDRVLVLYGDVPLISEATLQYFIEQTPLDALGIVTAYFADPTGLGRIIRNEQRNIVSIIEQKDLSPEACQIQEINTGIYLFPAAFLADVLPKLTNDNAQKEYYLTDAIKVAVESGIPISSVIAHSAHEVTGVNDKVQLAQLERIHQRQQAEMLMRQGVTLLDPNRFDVRGELTVGQDVSIDINVVIEGRVIIGNRCVIGPHVILRNVILGDDVEIKANSILEDSEISAHAIVGPFARLRPGTSLGSHVHIGNFVEVKNSFIGDGSKVNHLSYIGDTDIGKRVNIGAGTITCNYDGANKHRTVIGDEAFIGSNTSLVAPIRVGQRATVGAGSTITRDAPAEQLTLCRGQQRTVENWQRPKKKET